MKRFSMGMLALLAVVWASGAAAGVHWDDYRGNTGVPAPVGTPNYTNYPNGVGLTNLITFAAGGAANIQASGTSPNIDWMPTDYVLCDQTSNSGGPSCLDGVMGRVTYALVQFPEAGTYVFSAAHDDQVKVEFSSTFSAANAANYRGFSYSIPVGELAAWTGTDSFETIPGQFVVSEPNACYAMRIYWNNQGNKALLRLAWQKPSDSSASIIPETALLDIADPDSYAACSTAATDLAIAKTGPASFTPNVPFDYQVTVWNYGPVAASGVVVNDTLPTSLSNISWTCTAHGAATCGSSSNSGNAWAFVTGDLPVNASAGDPNTAPTTGDYLVYTATVTPDNVAGITNTATITTNDASAANNSSSWTSVRNGGVSVAKTGPATMVPGGSYSYTLTVTNSGTTATANSIIVEDQLPVGMTATGATGASCAPTGTAGALLTCTMPGPIAGGSSASFTIDVTAPSSVGAITNYASTDPSGSGGPPASPPWPGCDSATTSCAELPSTVWQPRVEVAKSADPADGAAVSIGDTITYTLTAQVLDAPLQVDLDLTDTLGAGLTFGSVTSLGSFTANTAGAPSLVFTLPSGTPVGSYSVEYTATVAAGADQTVGNSVQITGDGGDPDPECTSCSTNHNVAADLAIVKTVDKATPAVGEDVVFTLTVTNNGPSDATGVAVNEALPNGYSYVSSTPSVGTYTAPTWTIGNLANGASATLAITATVNASGDYLNTASVDGNEDDPNPSDNEDTEDTSPTASADLSITKTASPSGTYVPGDPLDYTLTVSNAGPSDVSGASVTDTVPAQVQVSAWTCVASGSGADCDSSQAGSGATGSGNTIALSNVDLPAGTSLTISIDGDVDLGATGDIVNTATVTPPAGTGCSSAPCDDSATVTNSNGGSPEVSIAKTASPSAFAVGGTGSYALLVSNSGSSSTSGVITVTDPMPAGITMTATPTGTGWDCSASTASQVDCTTTAVLTPGANAPVINVAVAIDVAAAPKVDNTATVEGGGDTTCPGGSHCESAITTPVDAPQVEVTKTLLGNLIVGVPGSYVIQATNTGTGPTVADTITDTIPAGLTIGSLPPDCSASGQTVTCDLPGGLTNGQSVSYTIPVTPQPGTENTNVTNTATNDGGGDPSCPAAGHCHGDTTDTVKAPELHLSKTASPTPFVVGQPASYTLSVENQGSAATTAAATITDVIPASLTIGTPLPTGCSATSQTVTCTIAAGMATGTTQSFAIPVTPSAAANGLSLTNTADVVGGGDPGCEVGSVAPRCEADVTTPVNAPQLTVDKSASSSSFVVGVAASYTLKVTNTGTAATTDPATITDTIPTGLTIGSLPSACTVTGQQVSCTIATGLPVGSSVSYIIPVTPTAAVSGSVLTNTAVASGGGDPTCPTTGNCSDSVTTPVDAPALEIIKTASSSNFVVGVPASYTLTVTNTGSAATTAVATVVDNIPGNLSIGTLPGDCSAAGQQVTCSIAAGLVVGSPVSFVIPVTPTAAASGTTLTNTATVAGGGDPTCPAGADCSSSVDTPVDAPALKIVKTASASNFVVGVPASYTLTVTNTGSAATTAVATVQDNIPANLSIGTLPGDCSATGQQVTCSIAAGLAPGSPVSFTIPVTPTAAASGSTLTNTASVVGGGDPSCPAGADCSSTVDTPVDAPALEIVKTASDSSFVVGVPASYTLTVTNNGSAATTAAAIVSDNMPGNLSIGTLPAGCTSSGQSVSCTVAAGLASGNSVSFTIPVTPTAAAAGTTLSNHASVTGGGDPTCPGSSDCDSQVDTPVNAPALELVKTASGPSFVVGVAASYTLTVTNTGSAATTATASVVDNVPADLSIGSLPADCSAVGQQVTCSIAAGLAPGSSVSFTIPVTPQAAASGHALTNGASVSGGGDPACPADDTCHDEVTTPVDAPALSIVKSASDTVFTVGVPASYTLTVTNNGSAATTATTTVVDLIPGNLVISTLPGACAASGQQVSCSIASGLAAGASLAFTIPVTPLAAGAATTLSNTASVSGGGDPSCPASSQCSDTVTTPIVGNPSLQVVKSVTSSGPYQVGDSIDYKIVVSNAGDVVLTGVDVTDSLPDVTLSCNPALPATLQPGDNIVCSGAHQVDQGDARDGQVSNHASATGTDPAGEPVSGEDTVTTNIEAIPATPVPVDGHWMLLLLGLALLLVVAQQRTRRRR